MNPRSDPATSPVTLVRPDTAPTWHELALQKRRRLRGPLSFRGRLLLMFAILTFGSVGGATWLLTARSEEAASKLLEHMSNSVAHSLAVAASSRGLSRESLQTIADTQASSDLVFGVAFIDADGNTVASAGHDGVDAATLRQAGDATQTGPQPMLVTSAPILGPAIANRPATLGRVVLVTSMRSMARSTQATVNLVILVGSVVTLAAALLGWVLLSRSRRPLKDLVKSVRGVIAGDAEAVTEMRDNEQVAELSAAFNELIFSLRTHRAKLASANEDLAASIKGLEKSVADRTAQLESANDRLSGEIAEKEDFLRAVSHDLNAPLRNIGGMVSMLMTKNKDTLPADVVQRLDRIRKNVDVETDLINELLELSRIKTRRQTLELVDTEALVWDLRGTFENDLKTKHIDVVLETSLPQLYAERARVRQVFQNLIDNAIKYMGEGPVREIRVGCIVSVTEAAFYVRDTGLGIHPEDLDKVFFVFRRGRGEVASKVAGKGVGLSSVKSIIETYAGQIRVESTLGQGSAFHFTINGKYVPSVAGVAPAEMGTQASQPTPTLASIAPPISHENRAA